MNSKKGGKRVLQVSPTDANKSAKKKPPNKSFICPVCEEFIKDSSATSDGQDSILCEGTCGTWLHRKCAGLSKKAFQNVCNSKKPFLCSHCVINKHEEEITSLKSAIQVLTDQLSSIQAKLSDPDKSNAPKASSQVPQQKIAKPSQQSQPPSSFERNYNVVVYGIKESAAKTTRSARSKHDQESLTPIFTSIDPSIQNSFIKDFHRLGKYKPDHTRPRPILVKFLRAIDAQFVLAKRDKISQPIIIKPDLSKEDRDIQSILLRERWNLIQTGVGRRLIKIRNNQIYVNNQLFGHVQGDKFFHSDSSSSCNQSPRSSPPPSSLTVAHTSTEQMDDTNSS